MRQKTFRKFKKNLWNGQVGENTLHLAAMKKNFSLTSSVHRSDRVVESIKHDINKYVARERRKVLPEGVDYWDFDCRCGADADSATILKVAEFSQNIDKTVLTGAASVYVEILVKPGVRTPRPITTPVSE